MHPGLICIDVSAVSPFGWWRALLTGNVGWSHRVVKGACRDCCELKLRWPEGMLCWWVGGGGVQICMDPSFPQSASWRGLNGEPGITAVNSDGANLSCVTLLDRRHSSVRVALGVSPFVPYCTSGSAKLTVDKPTAHLAEIVWWRRDCSTLGTPITYHGLPWIM